MTDLDHYLARHYWTSERLAQACGISLGELAELIRHHLVPGPSYQVTGGSTVHSFVFGSMDAKGSKDGRYFHPATEVWVRQAKARVAALGLTQAQAAFKREFQENVQRALAEFDQTTWPLRDCFAEGGTVLADGLHARLESMWEHFLHGTFGLCVANPASEREIVRKEILQEKLAALTQQGRKPIFSEDERAGLLALMAEFSAAAMPFSPVEYAKSSRKRLVDDLRIRMSRAEQPA